MVDLLCVVGSMAPGTGMSCLKFGILLCQYVSARNMICTGFLEVFRKSELSSTSSRSIVLL